MNMRDLIRLCERETTPFEQWFAGSKLVDASGNPIKLFHGTSKDQNFRAFKMPKNGIWFTTDPASASQYAEENDSKGTKYDWETRSFNPVHTASRVIPCYVRAMNIMHYEQWPDALRMASNYKRAQAIAFDQLRTQGYDTITCGEIVVVIGNPNQIKSAIGNKMFDPSKKNIDEEDEGSSWPPVLKDSREIANYIESVASDYVDTELMVEHFWGAKAVLKLVPLSQIKPGDADHNIGSASKTKKYLAMDPATMPPLVVENGEIMDGNHRYRVAKKLGLQEVWCYVVEDE
jgi:hypothetical protein